MLGRRLRCWRWADDDFFDDMNDVVDALHEEHAHGIDIEIERPDEGMEAVEAERGGRCVSRWKA